MIKSRTSASLLVSLLCMAGVAGMAACGEGEKGPVDTRGKRPDALPVMLNKDLPFRYPPALYVDKVQGNVTLRLFIDEHGVVVNDSTKIVESSNTPLLDSAAVKGARDLKFEPAKLKETPMAVAILFPVYFRHPEVAPPPGDSALGTSATPPTSSDSVNKK